MARVERSSEDIEIVRSHETEAIERYLAWAATHTNEFIGVREYDPEEDPNQRPEVIHIPAKPDIDKARILGSFGMGEAGYGDMVRQFIDSGLLKIAREKIENGQNVLVVTPHLKYIWDTALTHNGLFVASGDPSFAERNVIVINQMLKFLKMGGVAVTDILATSGDIVIGDVTEGAKSHGVPEELSQSVNRLAAPVLKDMLAKGVIYHRALTGTRADITPQGLAIPLVKSESALSIRKRTPDTVPIAIQIEPGNGKADVLPLRHIKAEVEVHAMMSDLAEASAKLTGEPVIYGPGENA